MRRIVAFVLVIFGCCGQQYQKPPKTEWVGTYNANNNNRHLLADWLLTGCWSNGSACNSLVHSTEVEFPGYDGWYNNLDRPDSGAVDGHLLRRWPAAYEDGTYAPARPNGPNPLNLSDQLLSGDIGSQSRTGKNALLVFFGQQVVEEILDAQRAACPPEYFDIKIPETHNYFTYHSAMPFLRTRYDQKTGYSPNNPRQQLNEITPYFDGGLMYGITKQWADQLRTYSNGTIDPDGLLAYSHGGLFPEYNTQRLPLANPPPPFHHADFIRRHEIAKVSRFFKLGNPRGNENTFLLTFGVLWFRWHNYIATGIRRHNRNWSSDKVFNEARKWVIATQQHIVYDEWLPSWLDVTRLGDYAGYDPSVNPQIDQFFQSAAFRFGHTLVVPGVYLRDYARNGCNSRIPQWGRNAVRTCNSFWRPQDAIKTNISTNELVDIDRVLMGLAVQLCEEEDHKIVEDLRGNVFGPLEFPRRDLMAVNIQRGRDHGLPDFNSAREAYGLPRINNSNHFRHASRAIQRRLHELYDGDYNNIDPWVGGILETGDGPGELFEAVILDQFRRIRNGDRFWYANTKNKLFTPQEIDRINSLRLYDIIMAVTKMDEDDIQEHVFRVPLNLSDISNACVDKLNTSQCRNVTWNGLCYHLPQLNQLLLNESCLQGSTYDYFSKSEVSYILSFFFVGAFIVGCMGLAYTLIVIKQKKKLIEDKSRNTKVRESMKNVGGSKEHMFLAKEWVSRKENARSVIIKLSSNTKHIKILSQRGVPLRSIDLSNVKTSLHINLVNDKPHLFLMLVNDYDLVLQFESEYLRDVFQNDLQTYLNSLGILYAISSNISWSHVFKSAITHLDRKEQLESFFRVVFAQAFKIKHSQEEILNVDTAKARILAHTEITLVEFAEVLNMRPEAEFVNKMFHLVDKDGNGSISYREFTDLLVIFANGTEQEKAKLLFDMYDINAVGYLTQDEFLAMIKSFLETVGATVEQTDLDATVKHMLTRAGLQSKNKLEFNDFVQIVGKDIQKLNKATLGLKGVSQDTRLDNARSTIENIYESHDEIQARIQGHSVVHEQQNSNPHDEIQARIQGHSIIDEEQEKIIARLKSTKPAKFTTLFRYIEKNASDIFWMSLYTLVLLAIFAERAYHYSVESEHTGLRRIAGYGVTVTRGAASAMMFTYSSLLVTMCRNTISYLRETVFSKYFPVDSMIEFHKYIAVWALIFTVMHIIGHGFNFYHISTQTSDDLTCLFRNYFHATHEIPKFHYWCWQTITGFTGIVLTLIGALMFIFAHSIVRRRIYNWFWYTHSLYPLFFIFMILHGTGRLIQEPFFHYFFLGPLVLFILDTVISVRRKKIQIPVLDAQILPSGVTMLRFRKPDNFEYKSGQWVRIACLGLNPNEYHPFTLSSSPDESALSVHIRAVGPWTTHIRQLYDAALLTNHLPKIYLDGPYGESHQDWYQYDVSVLVGGGIGVTPFASILKDIVFAANSNVKLKSKKVYFIWVSRTQKQFEWMVDIIRDLEKVDRNKVVSSHIYITEFFEKFDLRTVLLYICERHFQRIAQKSLFTNLEAITHFGRPSFPEFFKTLQTLNNKVKNIGVFSCGPPSMTSAIESACFRINKHSANNDPVFEHHFKNF